MQKLPEIGDCTLRDRAFTHRSFTNENPGWEHNERLEFLGDALLGFLVADLLYEVYPEMTEAELTRLRSQLVDEPQLARFARQFEMGAALNLGRGAERDGGRDSDALLCDTFEAYLGALYLDSGIDTVRAFVDELMEAELDRREESGEEEFDIEPQVDIKGRLQQWALANRGEIPQYAIVGQEGPDHQRMFTAEVRIAGEACGRGTGKRKQEAEKAAARNALLHLGQGS
ncbi:MAG: ribonuclease III [Geitlerinemataceae cyanobacterium]